MSRDVDLAIFTTTLRTGGAERVALNLCNGLVTKGYEIDLVLVNEEGPLLEELDERVRIVDLNSSRVVRSIDDLYRYLSENSPATLLSFMTHNNIVAILTVSAINEDIRLVLSEHSVPSMTTSNLKDRLIKQTARSVYWYADHIIAVSKGTAAEIRKYPCINQNEISVVYNPIVNGENQWQKNEPVEHPWFFESSNEVVLSAGRFVPEKDYETLLDAFAKITKVRDVKLILLGDGPQKEVYLKKCDELGIEHLVDFPGFVDNPLDFMANADCFVVSSRLEGFGNVLVEAMSMGCPVVSTDCPVGPAEILSDGEFGELTPVGDINRLSTAIAKTLDCPPNAEKLRLRALDFTVDKSVRKYEKILF